MALTRPASSMRALHGADWRIKGARMQDGQILADGSPASLADPAAPIMTGAERLLWEASERALRQPQDKCALVLHLSRLAPPAPRPHHIRVATVLLQDSAQRFGGQIFALRNRDLVLLCASADAPRVDQTLAPQNLPQTLARLFAADVPDPALLTSLWMLETESADFMAYVSARAAAPPGEIMPEEPRADALSLATLEEILAHAPLAELMVQQTGMALDARRARGAAHLLAPCFREISLSLAGLNLGPLVAQALADPYLRQHFAASLDLRLIQLLHDDLADQGRLTRPAVAGGLALHIDLGPEAVLSPAFARLSRVARTRGVKLAVGLSLMLVAAEADLMTHVRDVLALTGSALILTQVDPLALALAQPARMQPDLIKLNWSAKLADAVSEPSSAMSAPGAAGQALGGQALGGQALGEQIARALARLDPARLVLREADSEQALIWGQSHGIGMYQGPYLDQVQAATRMAHCHSAAGCTLRQCRARGTALGLPGRAGCANPGLLESGITAG